ncbi:helix-turn-helix domain-containing protein [Leucobacter sp. CSA1]|uniref:Helix-turn-helix domain-containing protein n=1 Tax=Leucobacter chromiisoli TaxID=2796471 RepID=A0A934UU21_9MICO|nr:helix-turn-helix domain-containing protein [Leucobacter chromiisoli]MBK0418355.1 helix-turn-helix domain-containing protein [Leucobacter chromiisoli]
MAVNDSSRAPAVRRAVAALDFLAHIGRASAADVSRDLGLAKSSTADLLATMQAVDLVRKRGDEYELGALASELTAGFVGDPAILDGFAKHWARQPIVNEHTVTIETLLGATALCLDLRIGRYVLPSTPRIGRRIPLWDGAAGSPLLLCMPTEALARTLERFEGFDGSPERTAAILEWRAREAPRPRAATRLSSRGNIEISLALPVAFAGSPPVTVTAHLPPESENGVVSAVSAKLEDLANAVVGSASPTSSALAEPVQILPRIEAARVRGRSPLPDSVDRLDA